LKKGMLIACAAVFLLIAGSLGGIKLWRIQQRNQPGILLAFDDYSPESWEENFDLFDKYDARVTFFINAGEPTEFCYAAQERGHEIGFHTITHRNLLECTEDEMYQEAIVPIETFREEGFELTSFAYPYGNYNDQLNEKLLEHYNIVRGAWQCELNLKHNLRHGFVEAMGLDNGLFESQEAYEKSIRDILTGLKKEKGMVICMYSHAIGDGSWCISGERLEYLLQTAEELGLKFYRFQDLQDE
jgi:peptidoglycan/xylan/chitin deacetylase (PgdA/CDA1 family)